MEIEVVVWVVLVDVVAVESVRLGFIVALSSILTESEVNKVTVVLVRVDIVGVVSTPPTFQTISSLNGGVIVGSACFCWTADTELSEDTVTVVEVVLFVLVPDVITVWVRVSFTAAGGLTQRGTWVVMLRLLSCHLSSSASTHLGFKLPWHCREQASIIDITPPVQHLYHRAITHAAVTRPSSPSLGSSGPQNLLQ